MSTITILNTEQVSRAIRLLIKASKLGPYQAPCIIGPPGVGKTDLIQQLKAGLAEATGGKFRGATDILSYRDATDFGVPFKAEDGRVDYCIPRWLHIETDEYILWLLDEFDRAEIQVKNAGLQILRGGNIHGKKIGKNVYPVLAMNGSTDIYTTPLSKAEVGRICCLYTSAQAPGQVEQWQDWASKDGLHPATRAFPRFVPDAYGDEPQFEEYAYCSPRTLAAADYAMRAAETCNFETRDILPAVVSGLIGAAKGTELLAYHDLYGKAPSIEEIEADPDNERLPTEVHIRYALAMALCDRKDLSEGKIDAVIRYLTRMDNVEVQVSSFRKLIERNGSDVINNPTISKWIRDNAAVLK